VAATIQGPLYLFGGLLPGVDRTLRPPLALPGEEASPPLPPEALPSETTTTDRLVVHNDTSQVDDVGTLSATHIDGLGMGPDLTLNVGTFDEPEEQTFEGGITYQDFEIVELLLGQGDEDFTVTSTAAGAITVVHGGGGDDTLTATGGGGPTSPLILYGDTSQDHFRYQEPYLAPSTSAVPFDVDGDDVIDASAMTQMVVIYGGGGNDLIRGGAAGDHLAGGSGDDEIHGGGGIDHIYGDSGFNQDLTRRLDQMTAQVLTVATVEAGGADTIFGDGANDLIFGDHGIIAQTPGLQRITSTGQVIGVETTNPAAGGADSIDGGADQDIAMGGGAGDTIRGGAGRDLLFGDFGRVQGTVDANALPLITLTPPFSFVSIDIQHAAGGDDVLYGDGDDDLMLGQQGSDAMFGGDGNDDLWGGHNVADGFDAGDRMDGGAGFDVLAGDNALITRRTDLLTSRVRQLGSAVIYDANGDPTVTAAPQLDPTGAPLRNVTLLDHSATTPAGRFGGDYMAGGAGVDTIFGQLGDDVIQGDGAVATVTPSAGDVRAVRVGGLLQLVASVEAASDGDDYIEGGGGNDVVFGNLGQDDIIGGSSQLFGLLTPAQRPDGSDLLFGGAGTDVARNHAGDTTASGHARDADAILGDNGNLFRLIGAGGQFLQFNYDQTSAFENRGALRIIPRAAQLLDYTPGGPDFSAAAAGDIGAGDEVHGESGDDQIYGMLGPDVLFGDGQDDDIIGGTGHDWVSAGAGVDGVIGDDGRISTSRNTAGNPAAFVEPLYGVPFLAQVDQRIDTPGDHQIAVINRNGQLTKTVNLTPFQLTAVPDADQVLTEADDIIYGGLGHDFLHGSIGDDAISGAEALPEYFAAPVNAGDVLKFGVFRAGEFGAYNEFDPLRRIQVDAFGQFTMDGTGSEFLLNFDESEGPNDPWSAGTGFAPKPTDGDDVLFGDLGNDWLVGGSGRDTAWGGRGSDLINLDDDHDTTAASADPRANDLPDTHPSYEDRGYGGAGRDVLIANTGGDRLIDWVGEFNSYLVPFAPFGASTISRTLQPQLKEFLYALSESQGADPTRAADTGADPLRNGEPFGEIGLVEQRDIDWRDQTGAPADPQAGNIPGGPRDVLRSSNFDQGAADGFAPDVGGFAVTNNRYQVNPLASGQDTISVFYVDAYLPNYWEMSATINAVKPIAGFKANAYLVFDYQSPTDFKFAGIDVSTNKIVIGHRASWGWAVDKSSNMQLKAGQDYNVLLSVNGTAVTMVVNNTRTVSHTFAPRQVDGFTFGLNAGMVGLGADNGRAQIDNVSVQVIPPEIAYTAVEDFADGVADGFSDLMGIWQIVGERLQGASIGGVSAIDALDLNSTAAAYLELSTRVSLAAGTVAGVVFDYYSPTQFKFATLAPDTDQVVIGHVTPKGWFTDSVSTRVLNPATEYTLEAVIKGTTLSVRLNGQLAASWVFNGVAVDGKAGLLTRVGSASFDDVSYRTSELAPGSGAPLAASGEAKVAAGTGLDAAAIEAAASEARALWAEQLGAGAVGALDAVSIQVADLPGSLVGSTVGGTVWLDRDAAGHGWFRAPADSGLQLLAGGGLLTEPRSSADGAIDLLSVVAHEFGHVLGFEHSQAIGALEPHKATEGANASVARTAQLGHDVVLGDRVRVEARARIGDGSTIGADSVVEKGARIGERVRIGEGAVIGAGAIVPDDAVVLAGTRVSSAHESLRGGRFDRSDLRAILAGLFDLRRGTDEGDGAVRRDKGRAPGNWLH
jgi:Ca2+-binding RTX toxin-like protein